MEKKQTLNSESKTEAARNWTEIVVLRSVSCNFDFRPDYQPMFGKEAHAPSRRFFSGRNVDRTKESGVNTDR